MSFHCTKQGDFGPWFCELFAYAVSQKAEISKNFWDLTGKKKDVVKFSLYWALGFFSPPLYNPIILNVYFIYHGSSSSVLDMFVSGSDNRSADR